MKFDKNILINNIRESNLTIEDKDRLISILGEKKIDKTKLLDVLFEVLKMSRHFKKFFDIDIGEE